MLADDHPLIRHGIKVLLNEEGFEVVGEASDGHEAVLLGQQLRPDIAILDISMPRLNGIDAAREILKASPKTKVILLTMYPQDRFVLASLRAGVTGYVLKSKAVSGLVQAIGLAQQGEIYLSPGVSRTVVNAFLQNCLASPETLSAREREVLQLIAEGKNMKEIGGLLGISAKTAESHRTRLMQKLDIHETAGLVRYAIEIGLVTTDSPCLATTAIAGIL
jgi:DNA-binding NarL/FixJ family response regulator